MTTNELCKHELTKATCDFCKPKPKLGVLRRTQVVVPAGFDSFCHRCGGHITEGDPITVTPNRDWVHEECVD